MMKKRIALLGLLGCMALCSQRVQAVTVLFDGQIYELSDADYNRYQTVSRVRSKGGDTQEKADARVRELLSKLDDQIVKPVPPIEETLTTVESTTQKKVGPPVAARPTQEQLNASSARRALAMPATPVHATAASASTVENSEMCCLGKDKMSSACACGSVTPQRGTMAQDSLTAKRMTFSHMDQSDPRYAGLKAELDAASAAYAQELSNQMGQMQVGTDFENPDEEADLNAAIMASIQQSTRPALSTGSVTPPAAVEENVRPHDEQYRDVMVVPGELGSQLTPAEIVDRNEELIRAELALATAENVAATERMLAQEAAREKAERLRAVIAAYKTARGLQQEMELIELLRAFTTGFTEREKIAFKRALQKGLEEAALLEVLDELYGRS